MTRSRTKLFREAVSALIIQVWEENKLDVNGVARTRFLMTPYTLVQAEFSFLPAPQALISSNQLT
ncbi:hypothetical protein J1N35_020462 [Gossypium stocksii]|uniref:Uncharacterized protein n=1 Tax=Gossypium stocksii TaxID=47602 RepID=A0A9D3VDB8_9ROSI|nr:hypothetical protein J1N35_020462 [Gossypium stocksii]